MTHQPSLRTHQEVLKDLRTSQYGLTNLEAKNRLIENGKNVLPEQPKPHPFLVFVRQFTSPLIGILLISVAVLFWRGDHVDALIVFSVLLLNAVIGVIQEGKSAKALDSLKDLTATSVTVLRDKKHLLIPDTEVVVGDIVILEEGNRISADLRLLRISGLSVNESILTGESEPVKKHSEPLTDSKLDKNGQIPLFHQVNMAFKGTFVTGGSALGVVTATGINTAIGSIYSDLLSTTTEIPLQKDIDRLSKQIIVVAFFLSLLLVGYNLFRGVSVDETLALVISLAVSIIPEGLPIVLTYVLATGVAAMAKKQVLVKRMQAVETLGRTTVLAVDKTGTITKNELAATETWSTSNGRLYHVVSDGYSLNGSLYRKKLGDLSGSDQTHLSWLSRTAALSSTARIHQNKRGILEVSGDPTEAALTVLAGKLGVTRDEFEEHAVLVKDYGFDYKIKLHYTVHKYRGSFLISVSGAPESFFAMNRLKPELLQEAQTVQETLARRGLRVVGLGHCVVKSLLKDIQKQTVHLDGLVGIQDTLHEEVEGTVRRLRGAGIKTVMITGDHAATAQYLAGQAGIYSEGDAVLTGYELEALSEDELAAIIRSVTVFARVTPEHKLRIVQAFRSVGITIAMTGDGVNDAPSLIAADLGVAMGLRGTEVAKESAELVLLNDNLGSIVVAVEEGRGIYKSIQRVIIYLFSGTTSLVFLMIVSIFALGLSPLFPSQIIWLNFVTDVLLVLALTSEPREKGLLNKGYVHPKGLITVAIVRRIAFLAFPIALAALYTFYQTYENVYYASTMVLTVLAVCHWFNAWNVRSNSQSLFNIRFLFANRTLLIVTGLALFFQLCAVYVPFLQDALHTVPLSAQDWLFILIVSLPIIAIEEVRKSIAR